MKVEPACRWQHHTIFPLYQNWQWGTMHRTWRTTRSSSRMFYADLLLSFMLFYGHWIAGWWFGMWWTMVNHCEPKNQAMPIFSEPFEALKMTEALRSTSTTNTSTTSTTSTENTTLPGTEEAGLPGKWMAMVVGKGYKTMSWSLWS